MQNIVETDATTIRLRQHPRKNETRIILERIILMMIIWITLVFFVAVSVEYLVSKTQSNPNGPEQQNSQTVKKPIYFIASSNNEEHQGIVNDGSKRSSKSCSTATWSKTAVTVAGGNDVGFELNQLAEPNDMFIDSQNAIYIADSLNNRIVEWNEGALQGHVVAGGNGEGDQANQLNYPTAVFVDRLKNIYIADNRNDRIQKWSVNGRNGQTIIGQFGRGNRLDQIDNCWGLYVDRMYNIYVSEFSNHRVTKWSPEAQSGQIVVKTYAPMNIHVDEKTGDIYVISYAENSVKRFAANGLLINQIGEDLIERLLGVLIITDASSKDTHIFVIYTNNLTESEQNQCGEPKKIQFDSHGNMIVLDSDNNRVQNYSIESNSCRVAYLDHHLSPYSRTHLHLNIIQQSYDQKTSSKFGPSKSKDSLINEIFFPQPVFREFASSADTDIDGIGIDLIKIRRNGIISTKFRETDIDSITVRRTWNAYSFNRQKTSSSRGRSGRRG